MATFTYHPLPANRPITKAQAYQNIIEWLYINDGNYPSKAAWRKAFVDMLNWNFSNLEFLD